MFEKQNILSFLFFFAFFAYGFTVPISNVSTPSVKVDMKKTHLNSDFYNIYVGVSETCLLFWHDSKFLMNLLDPLKMTQFVIFMKLLFQKQKTSKKFSEASELDLNLKSVMYVEMSGILGA